ncbi:hypothetical protein [Natronococcus wangiae]|uniref:hypothetical protein n=1 Tax=Natronococcus wangiae TaxID=3068275 RepID=UPI00273F7F07|nr:hypothetical protein [Natronococcus sp. AD5]
MTDHEPTEYDVIIQRTVDAANGRTREAWTDSARSILDAVIGTKEAGIQNGREETT